MSRINLWVISCSLLLTYNITSTIIILLYKIINDNNINIIILLIFIFTYCCHIHIHILDNNNSYIKSNIIYFDFISITLNLTLLYLLLIGNYNKMYFYFYISNIISNILIICYMKYLIYIKHTSIHNNTNMIIPSEIINNYIITKEHNINNILCVICQLEQTEDLYIKTKCKHYFHCKCIIEWIKIKKECPICRCEL